MKQLANDLQSINLLHNPPEWAIASTAPSDNLKVRKRSNGQENHLQHGNATIAQKKRGYSLPKKEMIQYESNYPHAFIASGIGPDGDGDIRRKKRRKKMLRTGSIVVGCAAIFLGFVFSREYIPLSFSKTTSKPKIHVGPPRKEVISSETYEGIRLATVEGLVDIPKEQDMDASSILSDTDAQEKEVQDTPNPVESIKVTANPTDRSMFQKIVMDHHEAFCGLFCKHEH